MKHWTVNYTGTQSNMKQVLLWVLLLNLDWLVQASSVQTIQSIHIVYDHCGCTSI